MKAMLALLVALLAASPAVGDPAIVVRTTLDPPAGMVVGQRVDLRITVLFPAQMPYPPRVTVPDVPGLQVMQLETQGTTVVERTDGGEYVGKQFEFAVFPRRKGRFIIPAAGITLLDASGGAIGSAQAGPASMDVALPPGIDASAPVIASDSVTAREEWSRAPNAGYKPGDVVIRTITREADDVPALAMRDFTFVAPDGVRAYADAPVADDIVNRGNLKGRRTDRVTYVFEKPGVYVLPALAQPWWDLDDKVVHAAELPGSKIVVAYPPAVFGRSGHTATVRQRWIMLAVVAFLLVLLAVLAALWPRFRHARRVPRLRRAEGEPALRRALCRIARTGDAAATYTAFQRWAGKAQPDTDRSAVALAPLLGDLEAALFGEPGTGWTREQGRRLADAVGSFRMPRTRGQDPAPALPPLNPPRQR